MNNLRKKKKKCSAGDKINMKSGFANMRFLVRETGADRAQRGGPESGDQQLGRGQGGAEEEKEEEEGGAALEAAVISRAQSECQLAEQSMVEEQSSRTGGCCWALARRVTLRITHRAADMFDNSNYPFNCFNYDGDGYPSSSTDEEKKMCRPAYRYGRFSVFSISFFFSSF